MNQSRTYSNTNSQRRQQDTTHKSYESYKKERVPPLSIQYDKGRYAFTRGWIANPYPEDEAKGKEWQRGFDAAYFENIERREARRLS